MMPISRDSLRALSKLICWSGAIVALALPSFASIEAGHMAWADGDLALAESEFAAALSAEPQSVEASVNLALTRLFLLTDDEDIQAMALALGLIPHTDASAASSASSDLRWEVFPEGQWSYATDAGKDGDDAIVSGVSRGYWTTILASKIQGPGQFTFYWRIDDAGPGRPFGLYDGNFASGWFGVDDRMEPVEFLYGQDERTVTVYLGEGEHHLFWGFADPTDSRQSGARMVLDQFVFVPDIPPGDVGTPAFDSNGTLADGADLDIAFENLGQTDRPVFDNVTGEEVQAFLRDTLAAKLLAIEPLLAAYDATGPAYLDLPWSGSSWNPFGGVDYRFDQADALLLRAAIHGFAGAVSTLDQWDWSDLPIISRLTSPVRHETFMQRLLSEFPALLAKRTGAQPVAASEELDEAITLLRAADSILSSRPLDYAHTYLIRAEPGAFANIDEFVPPGTSVAESALELDEPGQTMQSAPLFDGSTDLRALLPHFVGNSVELGGSIVAAFPATFPDPNFNGVVSGLSDRQLTEELEDEGIVFWTFPRWSEYANNDSVKHYLFPFSRMEVFHFGFGEWFSFFMAGSVRPSVADYTVVPEMSSDLQTWSDPLSEPDPVFATFNTSDDGHWELNYHKNRGPVPARLFGRVRGIPDAWPDDLTGWSIAFTRREAEGQLRWEILDADTVRWSEVSSGMVTGDFPALVFIEARTLHVIVEGSGGLSCRLAVDRSGNVHYTQPAEPVEAQPDTAWHLFKLSSWLENYEGPFLDFTATIDDQNHLIEEIKTSEAMASETFDDSQPTSRGTHR